MHSDLLTQVGQGRPRDLVGNPSLVMEGADLRDSSSQCHHGQHTPPVPGHVRDDERFVGHVAEHRGPVHESTGLGAETEDLGDDAQPGISQRRILDQQVSSFACIGQVLTGQAQVLQQILGAESIGQPGLRIGRHFHGVTHATNIATAEFVVSATMLDMSEDKPALPNRQNPFSEAFKEFICTDWAPYSDVLPEQLPASVAAVDRRAKVSELFPGDRLVIPAGGLKVRSNDTDFRYRPHSAFAHLTGLGTDREPDAVLVLEPTDDGHDATLYFKPRAPRTDPEFYSDARYGEMWVGQRESLPEMSAMTGLSCAPIADLDEALAKNADATTIRIVRDTAPELTTRLDQLRGGALVESDDELTVALSELRLVKDAFEAEQLREACRATAEGFAAVVTDFPEAVRRGRGERWVEGVFGLYARHAGNAVGYDTIAAAGDHANTLHWIRNDGELRDGDLVLIDAGVELDTLYTADITRTLPVSGTFSAAQRKVYEAVLEAQEAAMAVCRPGTRFADVHQAAITVIATRLHEWGILPVAPEVSLDPATGGHHRRWMVHGTSHHLGIDVHDCAQARQQNYRQGVLAEGMVITVEPGIYFRSTDQLVPEELRGIGIRIEDDILITADGHENLSAMLPRSVAEVEAWMAPLLAGKARSLSRKE